MNRRSLVPGALAVPWIAPISQATAASGPDLSRSQIGPLSSEFQTAWRTGQGKPRDWQVVEDATASQDNAIAQLSVDTTDYRFPLAVWQPWRCCTDQGLVAWVRLG
jgi:hypothetical protein